MTDVSMNPQPPRRPQALAVFAQALGYLTGEGRRHTPEQLMQQLHERFRLAGREKLADLVYELAKACLRALPDFSVRTLLQAEPRPTEVISGEMSTLTAVLRSTGERAELPAVGRRPPEEQAALSDAHKCLTALATLEGGSGRHQLATALVHVHEREPGKAETVLRALLVRRGESPEILRLAEVNLAFALLRQQRYTDVLPVARAAIARSPDDPVPWFNLLAAQSELSEPAAFEDSVRSLAALQSRVRSPLVGAWTAHDLPMLGQTAGLPEARVLALRRLLAGPAGEAG